MRIPDPRWRPWIYRFCWLGGGVVLTAIAVWMIADLQDARWGSATAQQRLQILGVALYMVLSGPLLVMIGLGLRNAIRNLKGTAAGMSLEVEGHEGGEP